MFDNPTRPVRLAAVALAASLAAAVPALAAGDHEGGHGPKSEAAIGHAGDAAEASRTVTVVMTDNAFEPETIEVSEGETVRFVIENQGELVHEFNIGTAAMHAEHQDEMMKMMEQGMLEVDEIHRDMMGEADRHGDMMMSHDHANSVLLEPGESAELVWTFDADTDLEFACNVPGHYQSGMRGDIHMDHAHGEGS